MQWVVDLNVSCDEAMHVGLRTSGAKRPRGLVLHGARSCGHEATTKMAIGPRERKSWPIVVESCCSWASVLLLGLYRNGVGLLVSQVSGPIWPCN